MSDLIFFKTDSVSSLFITTCGLEVIVEDFSIILPSSPNFSNFTSKVSLHLIPLFDSTALTLGFEYVGFIYDFGDRWTISLDLIEIWLSRMSVSVDALVLQFQKHCPMGFCKEELSRWHS